MRLPKVTSYLLIGGLLGWMMSAQIADDYIEQIEPLTKLVIAMETPHQLLSIVRRRDVFRLLIRDHPSAKQ